MLRQMAEISMLVVILGIASGNNAFAAKVLQWGDSSVGFESSNLSQVPLYISNATQKSYSGLASYVNLFGGNNNMLLLEKNGNLPDLSGLFSKMSAAGVSVEGVYTNYGGNNSVEAYNSSGQGQIHNVSRSRSLKLLVQNSSSSSNLDEGSYSTLEPGSSDCTTDFTGAVDIWAGCVDIDKKCSDGYVTRYKNEELVCANPCNGSVGVVPNSHPDQSCGRSSGGTCLQLYCRCDDGYVPSNRSCVAAIPNDDDDDCPSPAKYSAEGNPNWEQYANYVRGGWISEHCVCSNITTPVENPNWQEDGNVTIDEDADWVAMPDGVGGYHCSIPYGDGKCHDLNDDGVADEEECPDEDHRNCFNKGPDPDGTPGGCWCSAVGECGNKCDDDHIVSDGGFGCVNPCYGIIGPYNVVVDIENCSDANAYEPGTPGGCLAQYCACPGDLYPWIDTNPGPNVVNPYKCKSASHDCPEHAVSFEDHDSSFIPEGNEYKGDLGVETGQISEYCHCAAGYAPWKGNDGNVSVYCEEMSVIEAFFNENTPEGAAPSDSCRGRTRSDAVGTLGGCVCTNYVASYSSNNGVCSFACLEGYVVAEGQSSCVPACDGIDNATFNTGCTKAGNVGASRGCAKKYCQCNSGYEVGEGGTCVKTESDSGDSGGE